MPGGSPMALREKRQRSPKLEALPKSMIWRTGLMQHSLRSFLRLRLRLEAYPSELVSCGRSHARVPRLQLVWNSPLRFSERRTCGLPDRKAFFPSFSWFGKCNSSGGKPQRLHSNRLPPACCPFFQADRHRLSGQNGNGLKSCGSHMGLSAICSANRDKSPSASESEH